MKTTLLTLAATLLTAASTFAASPCNTPCNGGYTVPRYSTTCVLPPRYAAPPRVVVPPRCYTPSIPTTPTFTYTPACPPTPVCPPSPPAFYGKPQAPPTGQYTPPSTDWSKQYGKQRTPSFSQQQQLDSSFTGFGF